MNSSMQKFRFALEDALREVQKLEARAPEHGNELLTQHELAQQLRVHPRTLWQMRRNGTGPSFIRVGQRRLVYERRAVDDWLAQRQRAA
jgi:predicted DNA-binding transcriptional regulator AlpA